MTEEDLTLLKEWLVNLAFRFDHDLEEARQDFRQSENSWLAFRLAQAGERKQVFDLLYDELCELLKL